MRLIAIGVGVERRTYAKAMRFGRKCRVVEDGRCAALHPRLIKRLENPHRVGASAAARVVGHICEKY